MNDTTEKDEQVNVALDVVWNGSAGKYDARMSEIGLESCFINSLGREAIGEAVSLKMRLPEGHWITLSGTVVYQEYPIGFEVRFSDLTAENKKHLVQVVAAHGGKRARQLLLEQETQAARAEPISKRRVLVADDDPMTLRMVTVIAEAQDYEVVSAADGREAFKILQQNADFSAAIFDMMMPHLLGTDLIHYMKTDARLSHIPVGMITAEHDPKIWNESVTAGASVFLPKPFTPPQIQMMLRLLVSKGDL